MQRFLLFIDRVSIWVGKLFAWAVVLLTAVVCYEVFMRYVMGAPTTWAYDAAYILYGTLFIMAGAYALATGSHVRADVVYRLLSPRTQASIEVTLYIVFFLPAVLAFIYAGYQFAETAWVMGERSSFSPAGPPLYHFKSTIPLSGAFLLLQGVAEVIRCVIAIRTGQWPSRVPDVEEIESAAKLAADAGERAR